MKKRMVACAALILSAFLISSVSAAFIIESNPDKYTSLVEDGSTEYRKVTFVDQANGGQTIKYYKDGSVISLDDAPSWLTADGTQYIEWREEETNAILNDHITVDRDMVIDGKAAAFNNNTISGYTRIEEGKFESDETDWKNNQKILSEGSSWIETLNEKHPAGNVYIGKPVNQINLDGYAYNANLTMNITVWKNAKKSGLFQNGGTITGGSLEEWTHVDQNNGEYNVGNSVNTKRNDNGNFLGSHGDDNKPVTYNGDTTIALEHTEGDFDSSRGDEAFYKPVSNVTNYSGSSYVDRIYDESKWESWNLSQTIGVTNYVASRVVLNTDAVWTGTMSIGGMTGFYGNNEDFSQYNFTGFIMGAYCELDLNGHDLIVLDADGNNSGNHGMIDSWGSITDTSATKEGNLVFGSGTYFYSPFVIEDIGRIEGVPVVYTNNSPAFSSYRCPYINCTTTFLEGCKFYGKIKIDLAGNSTDAVLADLPILGDNSDFWFSMAPREEGDQCKIVRKVSYDQFTTNTEDNSKIHQENDRSKEFLINQKISYLIQDCKLNLNEYSFDIELSLAVISAKFNMNSSKSPIVIPHYFSFDFQNSSATFNNLLVFLPGTKMHVSHDSEIILTNGNEGEFDGYNFIVNIRNQQYHPTGGLYFVDVMPTGLAEKIKGGVGGWDVIKQCASAYRYYNTQKSYCDFEGKLTFNYDPNNSTYDHEISLGGNINFSNINILKNAISGFGGDKSKIQLYGSYAINLPYASSSSDINSEKNVINSFLNTPLISNGNVVMNISKDENGTISVDPSTVGSLDFVFDSNSRLIEENSYLESSTLAFIFNDYGYSSNIYKVDLGSSDSLAGKYSAVDSFENGKYIRYNGNFYVNYRGAFVQTASEPTGDSITIPDGLNKFASNGDNSKTNVTLSYNKYYTYEDVKSWN